MRKRCSPRWLLTPLALALSLSASVDAASLTGLSLSERGVDTRVLMRTDTPTEQLSLFNMNQPPRVIVDLPQTSNALSQPPALDSRLVRKAQVVSTPERSRLVLTLTQAARARLEPGDRGSVLVLSPEGAGVARSAAPGKPIEGAVTALDYRRDKSGAGRLVLTLERADATVDVQSEGARLVVTALGQQLKPELARRFDVSDFATPVREVLATQGKRGARFELRTEGAFEQLAYQVGNTFTLELKPKANKPKGKTRVAGKYSGKRLSLNFQDIEVRSVLQLLADFTELNLVASDSVSGRITLCLKDVPWDQALNLILKTRGLDSRREGNVIRVAPAEELAAQEKALLEAARQIEKLAPLKSEFIQINYAKAKDLAKLLKSKDNAILTPERGQVSVDDRTNTLLIRDTAERLEAIRAMIEKLDIPVRQVMIEARVVVASDDFAKDIGVRFGANSQVAADGNTLTVGGGMPGHLGGTFGIAPGIENPGGSGNEALMVNLPQTLSSTRGGAINFVLGKIGSYLMQLELSAMQQEGRGEIVSNPRVTTSDQHKAIIKQGVEIPYQEASSSGATTVSFKEAVLKLEATPHITPDDKIILDLVINKDSPDFSRSVLGVPPVDTRSIETSVRVSDGDTVVLGGVFEKTRTTSRERIPVLGDLPYVGFMFKQNAERNEKKELLVFVTPRIIRDGNWPNAASGEQLQMSTQEKETTE